MNYDEAVAYFDARPEGAIVPGLDRMRSAMQLLDDPQRIAPAIHITGTNGKSSVARIAAALLDGFGVRTGCYTSPHLEEPTERIVISGEPVDRDAWADAVGYLVPYFDEIERRTGTAPSYFEKGTILAFELFSDAVVGAIVAEVGLGGALDATNVLDAKVAVVTNISRDHTEYLGEELVGIAREKSGIIAPGAVVVTGVTQPDCFAVVEDRCREVGVEALRRLGHEIVVERSARAVGGTVVDVRTPLANYTDLFVPLHGAHQATNTALAVAAVEAFLDGPLDAETAREALMAVRSPGRLEVVGRSPLVVLDGAHNPAGVDALLATLRNTFEFGRLLVVVGVFADKDAGAMLPQLADAADEVWATTSGGDRSLSPDEVALQCAGAGVPVHEAADVRGALADAREAADEDDMILVTGSLHLVGAARHALRSGVEQPDPRAN